MTIMMISSEGGCCTLFMLSMLELVLVCTEMVTTRLRDAVSKYQDVSMACLGGLRSNEQQDSGGTH